MGNSVAMVQIELMVYDGVFAHGKGPEFLSDKSVAFARNWVLL